MLISTLIFAATLASAPVHSWQFIGAANDAALFVEDTSIVTNGNVKTAWVVAISDPASDTAKQYPGTYAMSAHQVDCRQHTDAISHMFVYRDNGDVAAERANPYPTSPVAPMSAGELVWQYVCDGQISTDKVVKLHELSEVKSFGVNWLTLYDRLQEMSKNKP